MQNPPKIKLTFIGDVFRQGAVPLMIVAAKMQALQQVMFHAAAAAAGHTGGRRGAWFNRYRPAAELTFSAAHHSELVIEAELPLDPVLHSGFDIGRRAVDCLFNVALAVERDNLSDIKLNVYDRDYLVRAMEGLMPNSGDQYAVKLENDRPEKHLAITFTAETRNRSKAYLPAPEQAFDAEEVTVVGDLIKIQVDCGEDKITVRSAHRNIDCFYGEAMRDQIGNLIAGSVVEVTGLPTFGGQDQLSMIYQVNDVRHVGMEPVRISRFEHGGRKYRLNASIAVNIEYSQGLWIYNHAALDLWGYAPRRDEALDNLHADFDDLYTQIAEEAPDKLDAAAQIRREQLRALVEPVSKGPADA